MTQQVQNYNPTECVWKTPGKNSGQEVNGFFLLSSRMLPNTTCSYRPSKATWGNAVYDIYEGFQCKHNTASVATDVEDAYNSINYTFFFFFLQCLLNCDINAQLVDWVAAALMERTATFCSWKSEPLSIYLVCVKFLHYCQCCSTMYKHNLPQYNLLVQDEHYGLQMMYFSIRFVLICKTWSLTYKGLWRGCPIDVKRPVKW